MDATFQLSSWIGWVKEIPEELIRIRPVLNVGYAWALISRGDLESGEHRLKEVEELLDRINSKKSRNDSEVVITSEEEFQLLPASIAGAHAYIASALGDVSRTIMYARRALDLIPEKDSVKRGTAASLMGLAYWTDGNLEAAYNAFVEVKNIFIKAGNLLFAISSTIGLADIRINQGRLRDAAKEYNQSIELGKKLGEPQPRGIADMYTGLGTIYCECGELDAARDCFKHSEDLGEMSGLPDWQYRLHVAQSRLKEVNGDLEGSLILLDEAEKLYYRTPLPNVKSIPALRTKIWIRQGRLAEALEWMKSHDFSFENEINFLNEFDHIVIVRMVIAQYHKDLTYGFIEQSIKLLDRLLESARQGSRTGSLIEILILQALLHEVRNNLKEAIESLIGALKLAEPEGYMSIFTDEGEPMGRLLAEINDQNILPDYTTKLLSKINTQKI
jgi:LuxR family maltose regulon positive regulatory protein